MKAAERTKVVYGDDVLRIETAAKNHDLGPSGSIAVTIQLPAGSRVEAKAASAELRSVAEIGVGVSNVCIVLSVCSVSDIGNAT